MDVWEALITFAFFPALVILAYITDKQLVWKLILGKRYVAEKVGKVDEDIEMQVIEGGDAQENFNAKIGTITKKRKSNYNFKNFQK